MSTANTLPASAGQRLEYFPIALYGGTMGLTGLSVAWHLAHAQFGAPAWVAKLLGVLALMAFVATSAAYMYKVVFSPAAVKAEFQHPIAGNLFGTLGISLLLIPIIIAPYAAVLARTIWILGVLYMTVFAWYTLSRWMAQRQQVAHATPAWIIPVVGMLDIPLAVPALDLPQVHQLMLAALAIGLFFAIPLFTLIFSRLVFEAPMPAALQPSLLILVAPFAVGFSAYVTSTGQLDTLAQALFFLTLFILAILLGRLRGLLQGCPFRVSWWSVSFPLAASTTAALKYSAFAPSWTTDAIALGLLGFSTVVIAFLLGSTIWGIGRGELRSLT